MPAEVGIPNSIEVGTSSRSNTHLLLDPPPKEVPPESALYSKRGVGPTISDVTEHWKVWGIFSAAFLACCMATSSAVALGLGIAIWWWILIGLLVLAAALCKRP